MSKFTEGLALLQEDFKERFGVQVNVEMFVFRPYNQHITRDVAEQITAKLQEEMGGVRKHSAALDNSVAWAKVAPEVHCAPAVEVTIFYPAEEGATV